MPTPPQGTQAKKWEKNFDKQYIWRKATVSGFASELVDSSEYIIADIKNFIRSLIITERAAERKATLEWVRDEVGRVLEVIGNESSIAAQSDVYEESMGERNAYSHSYAIVKELLSIFNK